MDAWSYSYMTTLAMKFWCLRRKPFSFSFPFSPFLLVSLVLSARAVSFLPGRTESRPGLKASFSKQPAKFHSYSIFLSGQRSVEDRWRLEKAGWFQVWEWRKGGNAKRQGSLTKPQRIYGQYNFIADLKTHLQKEIDEKSNRRERFNGQKCHSCNSIKIK